MKVASDAAVLFVATQKQICPEWIRFAGCLFVFLANYILRTVASMSEFTNRHDTKSKVSKQKLRIPLKGQCKRDPRPMQKEKYCFSSLNIQRITLPCAAVKD